MTPAVAVETLRLIEGCPKHPGRALTRAAECLGCSLYLVVGLDMIARELEGKPGADVIGAILPGPPPALVVCLENTRQLMDELREAGYDARQRPWQAADPLLLERAAEALDALTGGRLVAR